MNKAIVKLKQKGPKVANLVDALLAKGVSFRLKEDVWWMFISNISNSDFSTYRATTIGSTTYIPKTLPLGELENIMMLAQQYVHVVDNKKNKLFQVCYALPQRMGILGFLCILGILNPYLYALSIFLGCFAIRGYGELRSYTMSMAVEQWITGKIQEETKSWVLEALNTTTCWLALPKKVLVRQVNKQIAKIEEGDLMSDPVFHQVQMFLVENSYARHSLLDL